MTGDMRAVWERLHETERRVVLRIAQRVLSGQTEYGPLARKDDRNMVAEAQDELLDACVYLSVKCEREK